MTPIPDFVTPGGILAEIILWVRRIIKTMSTAAMPDRTIADYINRFYMYEMAERVQLFELKRQFLFETSPNVFQYQAPFLYQTSTDPEVPGNPAVPSYQEFRDPVYCDGIQMGWFQNDKQFYGVFPELVLNEQPFYGNGTPGPYTFVFGSQPVLPGFIDDLGNLEPRVFISAMDSEGIQEYIVDQGSGLLQGMDYAMQTILFPTGPQRNITPTNSAGVVNYLLGTATCTFNNPIPATSVISTQTNPYSSGFPRICLFFNNIFKLYPVPDRVYKIQMDAFVTPAQFMATTNSVPFAYMSEYIARGAARKILSDNGDYDQFAFYEPLFKEQEVLVLRRTERQNSVVRTPTIFSYQSSDSSYMFTRY